MEDLITIVIVIIVAGAKLASAINSRKRQNQPPPAPPPEFDAKMLEEMIFGDENSRQVIITRDDGVPTKIRPASAPEVPEYNAAADAEMLESQRRYAELAAQAEAVNAQYAAPPAAMAEDPPAEARETEEVSAADLADLIRHNPRNAVILSEILSPPKSLRS